MKAYPTFESEFLEWDSTRQHKFITLMHLSNTQDAPLVSQLLNLIHACDPSVIHQFITLLITQWPQHEPPVLAYITDTNRPSHIRVMLLIQITQPSCLTDAVLETLVQCYTNPKDAVIEPIIEAVVDEQPLQLLPVLIPYVLKPATQLRSQQLLARIGRKTLIQVLGPAKTWPEALVKALENSPYKSA